MASKTALYDENGKFVMYGTTGQALNYLRTILGAGTLLKVSHLSVAQITTLSLEQAVKLSKSYIRE
jgi:hypothetical protein